MYFSIYRYHPLENLKSMFSLSRPILQIVVSVMYAVMYAILYLLRSISVILEFHLACSNRTEIKEIWYLKFMGQICLAICP